MTSFKAILASLFLSVLLAGSAFASDKVNINTADAATLSRVLHNVGPSKADAIIAYRDENGPFRSVEQLAMVAGIGLKTVETNRDRIELDIAATRSQTAEQRRPASAASASAGGRGAAQQR